MSFTQDFSNLPDALYDFAINQILWHNILEFKESGHEVQEASDAEEKRRLILDSDIYGLWAWWSRFSTGFETLIKAVFLSNKISLITKNDYLEKGTTGSNKLTTSEAAQVYEFIQGVRISALTKAWLQAEFTRWNINHPYEINTGTLRKYKDNLTKLEQLSKISSAEQIFLRDAITVLLDIRRNVDAHVFLKLQVGGSINGDLSRLYIPSINILLRAYQR
ncbi:hypothetical protein CLI64_05150 [Nostoc sp. CENA543]|uniref:hypothetical protein n=1 Tax=Nostoc sp. CENA543 TaxID=1869241 RepID=UPI000CA0FF98|nr:hypothetical protein [Nostoc sp. CENA543]AUS99826.1 hypothetical protein CLI64_05150 [Nostoc sp. CENA543]